jgi:ABC-type sugar transport system ATPase subunit
LSGGQQQRVALARAIVRQPRLFLLDEPLSNLDAKLRLETRVELKRLQRALGVTTVYVTHDQEEAMTLADRVAVFMDGRIVQVAPPREIFGRPAHVSVAGFIGTPAMNLIPARWQGSSVRLGDAPAVEIAASAPEPVLAAHCRLNSAIAASSCRSDSASSSFVCSIFARRSGVWSRTKRRNPFSHSAFGPQSGVLTSSAAR